MKLAKIFSFYVSYMFFSGLILLMGSCATSSIGVQVLIPADITIPQHVQKVAIINRSLPDKENKAANIIEGILTGESIFADREGSGNCIRGLANGLNSGPRFSATLMEHVDLRGTGTREFPTPLTWGNVENLCSEVNADALIALETFDSGISKRKYTQQRKEKKDEVEITVTDFYSEMQVNINAGWRIYDNKTKKIIDEQAFMDNKVFRGKGDNPDKAEANLPDVRWAINEAGIYSGEMFARRISPTWRNESRMFFIRKGEEFKKAQRFVQHNDWDQAIDIWKPLTTNPEKKIGGRACFNMGIACEMKGEFDIALEWMKKAYYDYNIKQASQYINILNRRILDQQRLNEQMGN